MLFRLYIFHALLVSVARADEHDGTEVSVPASVCRSFLDAEAVLDEALVAELLVVLVSDDLTGSGLTVASCPLVVIASPMAAGRFDRLLLTGVGVVSALTIGRRS